MGMPFKSNAFQASAAAEDMAAELLSLAPKSDADALKLLRARFPDRPLSVRVAALDYLMRHRPRAFGAAYSPR